MGIHQVSKIDHAVQDYDCYSMARAFYLQGCTLFFQTLGPYLGDKSTLLDIGFICPWE